MFDVLGTVCIEIHFCLDVYKRQYPDNVKDFYETGMSYINNVAIAGGTERSDFRISVSTTNQTGAVSYTHLLVDTIVPPLRVIAS